MKATDEPLSVQDLMVAFQTDNLTIQKALGVLWAAGKVSPKIKRAGKFHFTVWEARDKPPKRKYWGEREKFKEKRKADRAEQKRAETFGAEENEWKEPIGHVNFRSGYDEP